MPKDFKEFAAKELAHAKEVVELLDSGQWTAGPELRKHYLAVINELEHFLRSDGGS